MVNLSELLSLKEKKILRRLTWLALLLVILIVSGLFLWSTGINSLNRQTAALQKEVERVSTETERLKRELEQWINTRKELEELSTAAFYQPGNPGEENFREDLRRLFETSGLAVPALDYQYEENGPKGRNLKKITASFSLRMGYPALKKFLYQVETWPKWLTVDQINFQRIESGTGILELRLAISGFMMEGMANRK